MVNENLAASGIPYQRVSGFDASNEDLKLCNVNLVAFQRTHGRRTIRSGEVGCYQSHLKAIQYFLDSGKEFGIILEDDVVLESFLEQSASQLIQWSGEWDIVALFHFHSGTPVKIKQQANVTLLLYLTHIASSAAYMLNRRSAATLLLHLAEQRACVDHALFGKWVHPGSTVESSKSPASPMKSRT